MVADRHAPLIQKRVRVFQNCPWVSSKIKQDIRQRDYYLKKARKTTRDEDWLNYRASRNRVTRNIKKAKQAYNKRLVESHCGDKKAFWKTMKKILPGERKSAATSSAIQLNGETCTDNLKIANGFNSFFAIAASRLMPKSLRGGGIPSSTLGIFWSYAAKKFYLLRVLS